MRLFYHPFIETDNLITFSEEERKHLFVLRLNVTDVVDVINGKGQLARASIVALDKKQAIGKIESVSTFPGQPIGLHLAISPLKNAERIEWLLEKACELGITKFTLIQCDRTERNNFKQERLEKIVVSACKQAKQFWFPILSIEKSISTFLTNDSSEQKLIAYCEEIDISIQSTLSKGKSTTLLIGPEGDFTGQEVEMAKSLNYLPVSLGSSRLRSETAGLYGVAVFRAINYL